MTRLHMSNVMTNCLHYRMGLWMSGLSFVGNLHGGAPIVGISLISDILDSAIRKSHLVSVLQQGFFEDLCWGFCNGSNIVWEPLSIVYYSRFGSSIKQPTLNYYYLQLWYLQHFHKTFQVWLSLIVGVLWTDDWVGNRGCFTKNEFIRNKTY